MSAVRCLITARIPSSVIVFQAWLDTSLNSSEVIAGKHPASMNTVSSVAGSPPARLTTTRITIVSWWYFHPLHTSRIVAEASPASVLRCHLLSSLQLL